MAELPRGTIAFLFTDIEGSTRLWQNYRDTMPAAYARHDAILHDTVAAYRGVVYKTVGDAFQIAFWTVEDAASSALDAQRALAAEPWATPEPPRVRMAIHVGTVEPQPDGDYRSPVLNRLGRLLGLGHGGQVLLSGPAADLLYDHLPSGVELRDLGTFPLKDLHRIERVFQLVAPGLPVEFPPLHAVQESPPTKEVTRSPPSASRRALPVPQNIPFQGWGQTVAGALSLVLLMVLVGVGVWRGGLLGEGNGQDGTTIPGIESSQTATPSWRGPTGQVSWSLAPVVLDDLPADQAFVGLGHFFYGDSESDKAQTLPGTLVGFVLEDPLAPGPWDLWARDGFAVSRGSGSWTMSEPGEYVTLHRGDGFVIPAGSPFNIRLAPGGVTLYFGAVVSPVELATPWPGLEQGEWLSTSLTKLPGAPAALTLHEVVLDPGESRRFTAEDDLLMLAPYGPEMTFASTAGTAEITYVRDRRDPLVGFGKGKEAPATPGAEIALDDVAGIFLPTSASGTIWNNGTETVAAVVLTIKAADLVTATPLAD